VVVQEIPLKMKESHLSHHLFSQPICSVSYAEANWQHGSWSTQGRLFEFPGKDSDCQDAENCTYDLGEHVIISFVSDAMMPNTQFLILSMLKLLASQLQL
jgi:hypothetical protein